MERVVAIQIENCFGDNKLLGWFQFGFRKNKNTKTELLTLFDTILEAKEKKKRNFDSSLWFVSSFWYCVSSNVTR